MRLPNPHLTPVCGVPCVCVLVSVSSWQAFPNTPWIFVYRDPVPVMMSLLGFKGGMVSGGRLRLVPFTGGVVVRIVYESFVRRITVAMIGDVVACVGGGAPCCVVLHLQREDVRV